MEALKDHAESNKEIFDTHQKFILNVIDSENELRDYIAETKEGESNGTHQVTIIPQTQTWADIEEIDKLIAEGVISPSLRERIVKTQDRPARVSIREIN